MAFKGLPEKFWGAVKLPAAYRARAQVSLNTENMEGESLCGMGHTATVTLLVQHHCMQMSQTLNLTRKSEEVVPSQTPLQAPVQCGWGGGVGEWE